MRSKYSDQGKAMVKKIKASKKEKSVVSNAYLLDAYRGLIVTKDEKAADSEQLTIKTEKTVAGKRWTIGESVVVKAGVKDPDTGGDIAGWQGRIHFIFEKEEMLEIQWDSVTLRNMSDEDIAWCQEECLSWSEMNLSPEEVEPATARDTEKDVAKVIKEIKSWAV